MVVVSNLKAFPRGGKIVKQSLKYTLSNDNDIFKKKKNYTNKKISKKKKKLNKLKREAISGSSKSEESSKIFSLMQSDLEPGMVLLGRIERIEDKFMSISLPGRLSGRVDLYSVSHAYTAYVRDKISGDRDYNDLRVYYSVGTYLSCSVVSMDISRHKVMNSLTTCPREINHHVSSSQLTAGFVLQCCVLSEEDHVYIVDTGIPLTRAILHKTKDSSIYGCGLVIWCVVDSIENSDSVCTLVVKLFSDKYLTDRSYAKLTQLNSQSLLPGMVLDASIVEIMSDGLRMEYSGGTHTIHMHAHKHYLQDITDMPEDYNVGARAPVTVLYTVPVSRVTHVTLSTCQLQSSGTRSDTRPLSRATLVEWRVLDSSKSAVRAVAPSMMVTGLCLHPRNIEGNGNTSEWSMGHQFMAYVVNYFYMDQMYTISLSKPKHLCDVDSYKVGDLVICSIVSVDANGCLVQIKDGPMAFVHVSHLKSLSSLSSHSGPESNVPSDKYTPGASFKMKVLKVDNQSKKLYLSHNKNFMKFSGKLLSDVSDIKVGCDGYMLVKKVLTSGLVLKGSQDSINGFLHMNSLKPPYPSCGDVLHIQVKSIRKTSGGKNRVTLIPYDEMSSISPNGASGHYQGSIFTARVVSVSQTAGVCVVDNESDRSIGFLHTHQLSDIIEHCHILQARLKVGDCLKTIGLRYKTNSNSILSAKHLLIQAIENDMYPSSEEHLNEGMVLPASVYRYNSRGVHVVFPSPALSCTYFISKESIFRRDPVELTQISSFLHRTLLVRVEQNKVITNCDVNSSGASIKLTARVAKDYLFATNYLLFCTQDFLRCFLPVNYGSNHIQHAAPQIGDTIAVSVTHSTCGGSKGVLLLQARAMVNSHSHSVVFVCGRTDNSQMSQTALMRKYAGKRVEALVLAYTTSAGSKSDLSLVSKNTVDSAASTFLVCISSDLVIEPSQHTYYNGFRFSVQIVYNIMPYLSLAFPVGQYHSAVSTLTGDPQTCGTAASSLHLASVPVMVTYRLHPNDIQHQCDTQLTAGQTAVVVSHRCTNGVVYAVYSTLSKHLMRSRHKLKRGGSFNTRSSGSHQLSNKRHTSFKRLTYSSYSTVDDSL